MKNWEKLNTKYLEWLEKNNFRRILSKKSIINGLSLWWTTNLCERDVINNNWYYDLYKVFFKKKLYKKKFNNLNFFFFIF